MFYICFKLGYYRIPDGSIGIEHKTYSAVCENKIKGNTEVDTEK